MKNYYATLGCHPMMTDEEIRAKYRALARQHHPDRPGGNAAAFADVTAAYAAIGTHGARQRLRGLYALHAPACALCGGEGYALHSKGFTGAVYTPCEACGGCGYRLEQAAKPRARKTRK